MAGIRDNAPDTIGPAAFREKYRTTPEKRKETLRRYRERGGQRAASQRYLERIRSDPKRYEVCKVLWREKARRYRLKPDNKMRALLKRHRISLEEYQLVVVRQGPGCGICHRTNVKLHLDHCHEDGHMRGLLCNDCNLALGRFGDGIDGLERALKYMRENF